MFACVVGHVIYESKQAGKRKRSVTFASRALFYKQRNAPETLSNFIVRIVLYFKRAFTILITTNHTVCLLHIPIRNGRTVRRRLTDAAILRNHTLCKDSEDRIFIFAL
jgi:hypothetical protein